MEILPTAATFSQAGRLIMTALILLACLTGISGVANLTRSNPVFNRSTSYLLVVMNLVFVAGFLWICWFHYQIHTHFALEIPSDMAGWLNSRLEAINSRAAYSLPLYDPANPPRYSIPVWIENEKYYFWFMCYAIMVLTAHFRIKNHKFRAFLHLFLAAHVVILFVAADPFSSPLPKFSSEIAGWLGADHSTMSRFGQFMRLYPKMVFYYNAHYMWFHPPMLFLAYGCITLTFGTSVFMLARRDLSMEILGYDFAKFGYFMLTLGMLLGYPWALQAWGPNWWWDPKICSSIMMWVIFTTYLHARLYVNKPWMWRFSSILGIICFMAMVFTFLSSFYFPGEHTFR
ncbi:MAG: cytochrome c biogenesis protein CcsA [Thermodesulfobacteriota bacterium]|nr:cytochrome c biogenesis protein CcsA [Thermodesulfobacteriota bacterium]